MKAISGYSDSHFIYSTRFIDTTEDHIKSLGLHVSAYEVISCPICHTPSVLVIDSDYSVYYCCPHCSYGFNSDGSCDFNLGKDVDENEM